jgi:hypothetical protein
LLFDFGLTGGSTALLGSLLGNVNTVLLDAFDAFG